MTSRTLASSPGSVENLKLSVRHGCRPHSRHLHFFHKITVGLDTTVRRAISLAQPVSRWQHDPGQSGPDRRRPHPRGQHLTIPRQNLHIHSQRQA
jgi:hypothetical protein